MTSLRITSVGGSLQVKVCGLKSAFERHWVKSMRTVSFVCTRNFARDLYRKASSERIWGCLKKPHETLAGGVARRLSCLSSKYQTCNV